MSESGKGKGVQRLAIAGAGAAGLSAALCAAKYGLNVQIIESENQVGGSVVRGQLHTLAGFLDPHGEVLDSPICREFVLRTARHSQKRKIGKLWVIQIDSSVYSSLINDWLSGFANVQLHTGSHFSRLSTSGNTLSGGTVVHLGGGFEIAGTGLVFLDATGSASLAALADPAAAIFDPHENSFAITLRANDLGAVPDQVGRVALKLKLERLVDSGNISVWVDSGFSENEVFVKISGSSGEDVRLAASQLSKSFRWTRQSELCNRNGGRIVTAPPGPAEPDNSFLVSWPFERWEGAHVTLESPPKMPFRLSENYLRARGFTNLFAAGKSAGIPQPWMSAARVVGSCWTMGEHVVKMMVRGNA